MTSRKRPYRRPLAIDDIAQHAQQIADNNLDAALRFLDAIETTIELLCQFPEAEGTLPASRVDVDGLRAKLVKGAWTGALHLMRINGEDRGGCPVGLEAMLDRL